MKAFLHLTALGGLLSGLLLAAPVAAQDIPIPNYTIQNQHRIGTLITQGVIDRAQGKKAHQSSGYVVGRPGSSGAAATRPAAAGFAYQPTPALKARTVQGYVDRLRAKNPAAQAVAQQLGPGKNDYGQIYRGIIGGTGLRDNDAADALAAYNVLGWMIVNDVREARDLPAGAPQGLRAQLAPALAADARLTAPGTAAQLGEEMKLLFVVVQGGWQAAIQENTLAAYQQGIGSMFKDQYGMDMRLFKLTPQGFAKK